MNLTWLTSTTQATDIPVPVSVEPAADSRSPLTCSATVGRVAFLKEMPSDC